jgi:hypothetical protein
MKRVAHLRPLRIIFRGSKKTASAIAFRSEKRKSENRRPSKPVGGHFNYAAYSLIPAWPQNRGQGNWGVKRKTAASRFTRAVRTITQWCRLHRHRPIPEQHQTLCQKLRGHYAYYGITGNSIALSRFREAVKRLWWKWLGRRRSGNRPTVNWFTRLLDRYPIPNAVAVHSVCRRRSEGVP